MFNRSWIRKLFARPSRTIRKAPAGCRPGVEALEDRTVPSVAFTRIDQDPVPSSPGIQDLQLGWSSSDIATADFNADGKLDLAVPTFEFSSIYGFGGLAIFYGYGDGTFSDETAFPTFAGPLAMPFSLAVADFNNDGKPDVVVGDWYYEDSTVFINDGVNSQFRNPHQVDGIADLVAAADIDGDGKADLVTADYYGGDTVFVRRGNGDGTFGAAASYSVGYATNFLTTADLNGDGRADVLVAGAGSGKVSVLLGQADGSLAAPVSSTVGAGPKSIAVADFNGDSKSDLAVANSTDNTVSVLLGNGNGTFQSGVTQAVGADPESVAVTDFNGDGKADLVAANFADNTVSVFLGRGNGTFQAGPTVQTEIEPFDLVIADWLVDGRPDVAVLQSNNNASQVRILAGHGAGYFTPGNVYDIARPVDMDHDGDGYYDPPIVNADFNGDGKPDLAAVNSARNAISVRLGVGDGTLADAIEVAYPSGVAPISMVAGDFDGDGKTDLITGNSGSLSWLRGKGDGTFHNPVDYLFPTSEFTYLPLDLAAGDINGDGHSDLVIRFTPFSGHFSRTSRFPGLGVLPGNGDGTFRQNDGVLAPFLYLSEVAGRRNTMGHVAVGDIDRDGRSDVIVGASVGANESLYVFRGRADGTLELTSQYAESQVSRHMTMADMNGDGWLDLAYTNQIHVDLRLNNQDGTFGVPIATNALTLGANFSFADMNGDGRLDLITRDYPPGVAVRLGRGNGTFETPSNDPVSVSVNFSWLGVGDFDRDGRIDVVAGNQLMLNRRPPVTLSSSSVLENQPIGTIVGTFHTDDPADPDNFFHYELVSGLGGWDNSEFTIDAAGNLRTAAVFDYVMESSYSIRVRCTDSVGVVTEKVFAISVIEQNQPPTGIGLSNSSVAENQPVGTVVGTLTTTDPDSGDSHTYTLVSGEGDADNASFIIDGNQLKTAAAFNLEAKSSYSIRVRSTDSGGLWTEKLFTVSVTNVNEAPTGIGLSNGTVAENQPSGTLVGTFTATDPDSGDSHTYTLVSGEGDADNASFIIDGNQLKTAAAFDFEAKSSYSIRVRSTDSGGLWTEKVFTVSVTNVNEAPILVVPAAQTVYEDVDLAIAGISVGDSEGDNLTVNLAASRGKLTLGTTAGLEVTGNGAGSVSLSGSIANLNAALATLVYRGNLNFSGNDTLNITVSDGNLSTSGSVALTIKSPAQQAADLRAQVTALQTTGVLSKVQVRKLLQFLEQKGNQRDDDRVFKFLRQVTKLRGEGILTQNHADALLGMGNILLLSMTRR